MPGFEPVAVVCASQYQLRNSAMDAAVDADMTRTKTPSKELNLFEQFFRKLYLKVRTSLETNYGNQFLGTLKFRFLCENFSPQAFSEKKLGHQRTCPKRSHEVFLCIFTAFKKVLTLLILLYLCA